MSVLFVFLGILKVILYMILIILFAILLLTGIVLFVPIKYKVQIDKNEQTYGILNVTWFFSLVRLNYSYQNGKTNVTAKALFWTILGDKNTKHRPKRKPRNKNKTSTEKKEEHESSYKPINEEKIINEESEMKTDMNQEPVKPDKNTTTSNTPNRNGFIHKIQSIYHKIIYIKDYPERMEIQNLTWIFIKRVSHTLKPTIFTLYGKIGFADPSMTGYVLGGLYSVSALIGADVRVKGDFEKEILVLKLFSKGRFMLWSIIWPLLRYISAKPIWKLVKKMIFS